MRRRAEAWERRNAGEAPAARRARRAITVLTGVLLLPALPFVPAAVSCLAAQVAPPSRNWRPEERTLVTDLTVVTAIAATRTTVYAATPNGLGIYDAALLNWRQTVGPLDGWPATPVTAMAANPDDDAVWMAGQGLWMSYDPFLRRIDTGPLPGYADLVVLDAEDPSRGAYFHTSAGWYFVARGGFAAVPASDLPPPARRLGGLTGAEFNQRLPAFDAARFRILRDDQLRSYRLTSAAVAPLTNEVFVGTDGNGAWRVDPLTYSTDRLPPGLLGAAAGAVGITRGQICVASSARIASPRRGISCFDEGVGNLTYYESSGLAGLPGIVAHAVLVTEHAVWVASDQGLLRAPRRGGRVIQMLSRDGLPSNQVLALAPAPHGVWVGTSAGLALVADTGRTAIVTAHADGPAVLALAATDTDTLWAGTSAGLVAFLLPIGGPVARMTGPAALQGAVQALALNGDTIVAATGSRFVVRDGGTWRIVEPPGPPVGTILRIVADEHGFWVAGDLGFAWFRPDQALWTPIVSPGDVTLPVRDIAASRDYVWVATDTGLLRFEKREVRR